MTRAAAIRTAGTVCALAVLVAAGSVLGGRWWLVALAGAVGALSGRTGSLAHAVATLALAGAAAGADVTWLVPLLVVGVVASVEAAALPARATRVRTHVPVGPAAVTVLLAGGVSAAVLALAALAPAATVPLALAATLAAGALVATARP